MKIVIHFVVATTITVALFAQSGVPLRFEAASVKPNDAPGVTGTGTIRALPGGRLSAHGAIIKLIVQNAYKVQRFQIVDGPNWIESARYDIEATAGSAVPPQQMPLMLQALLEDRFKLKVSPRIARAAGL